jgi:hypothetical protein
MKEIGKTYSKQENAMDVVVENMEGIYFLFGKNFCHSMNFRIGR